MSQAEGPSSISRVTNLPEQYISTPLAATPRDPEDRACARSHQSRTMPSSPNRGAQTDAARRTVQSSDRLGRELVKNRVLGWR